jgi:SAM-dependent methyltransferase
MRSCCTPAHLGGRCPTMASIHAYNRAVSATQAGGNPDQTVTLQHVREIACYNDWVFSILRPHLGGRVLELGCGIGTYSTRLRARARRLTCVDMDPHYVATVQALFAGDDDVVVEEGTVGKGLTFPAASFDAIVCLNVLEHIEDDLAALRELRSWLAPSGRVLLQVPAHPRLFGSIDTALGHWRRYTRKGLAGILAAAGFDLVLAPRYLYLLAIPGWWWFGRVRRRTVVPETTVRIANTMAAMSRSLESLIRAPAGLTLVAVGQRSGPA